jgi:hypothetical protein
MPFVAAMHGDIFYYPSFLLRLIFPTDVAMSLTFALHLFLAGLFTYLFLRRAGVSYFAALIGGVAYMLGGNVAGFASPGHDGKLYVSTLLPLALYFLLAGIRDAKPWAWGALAITVGLAVLSPHPQLLQYMLLTTGAFALFVARATPSLDGPKLDRQLALRRLGLALLAVVIGGAIGAIQYLPVREYTAWSPRAGGLGYDVATSYSLPIEEIVNFLIPQFTGLLDAYWGRNGIHLHSEYLGAVVLVLVGAAYFGRQASMRSFVWFWTGALIVSLLWALGGSTPFYLIVDALVPGTKFFRAPSTILYVVAFSVAMLAAVGVERVLTKSITRRYAIGWLIAGIVIALLGLSGALTNLALAVGSVRGPEMIESNASALALGAVRSFAFITLTVGLLFGYASGRIRSVALGWALTAVAAVDLWTIARHYWMWMDPARVIYASDPAIDYVTRQAEPGRVLALPLGGSAGVRDPEITGDGLMVHRVRSVLGYHGNHLARYSQLLDEENGFRRVLDRSVWRLLNVRYLLTTLDLTTVQDTGVTQLFGGTPRKLAGPARTAAGTTVYLFALPGDNPAAWVTPVIMKASDTQTLPTVLDPRFDTRRVALFDTSAAVTGEAITSLPEPLPIAARVTRYDPGLIEVELDRPAPRGAALVVSENYYPGWQATVDGKAAAVGRADFVLSGVALPEGARHVSLVFRSAAYDRGRLITILALAFGGVWCGWGIVRTWRNG